MGKYLLSVASNTSNCAVLGELGRYPLSVVYIVKCVKFWLKIVQDNSIRIRNSLYKMLKQYSDLGGQNWSMKVRNLLYRYGFGDVWLQQSVGDVNHFLSIFKQRLIDTNFQEWHDDCNSNSKMKYYVKYKNVLNFEIYLSTDIFWKHKIALTRFRCSNHTIC